MADGQDDQIARASSAYMYFSREQSTIVGDELRTAGKDSSIGNITSVVSERWKSLSVSDRAPYEQLAQKDKDRYIRECTARDAEVLRQQEERRKQNNATEMDTRMRGTTLQHSETSFIHRESSKRPARELTAAEIKQRDQKNTEKKKEAAVMKGQHDVIKAEKAKQAEARLKYLLSQSDIFAHFQQGKSSADSAAATLASSASAASLSSNPPDGSKRNRHRSRKGGKADADDALDEDEAAIVAEVDDDDEEGGSGSGGAGKGNKGKTVLLKQPSIINGGALREYQLEGLNWMIRLQENGINGILADEMGLGKTVQSISIIAYMHQFLGIKGPHLIMVPKSTLSNWMNEFKRFCPTIRVIRFHGNQQERDEIINEHMHPATPQEQRKWDVCVTTYEVVNLEKNALTKMAWRYLIIDEAHRLKNEASMFSQTVRLLQTQYRLLLTGTPLQNNLHELWALLNFLLPDVFSSADQFDEWFDLDVEDVEAKQRIIGQLHKLLRPFMLRRLKADVEKSLLPKTETILFIGMTKEQREIYKKVLLRDIDTINTQGSNDKDSKAGRTAVLNIVMQLRKCCNHPYLFPGIEDRTLNPLGDHLYQTCGKMVLLHRLLPKLYDRDHRVLIFSQMTRMLDILEDYLVSQGFKYCRIDGNTSYDEREDRIQSFNKEGSDVFIFLLSTRAGGLGINLQTADTVILYDSDWNPQADLQAQDRAHRIGQKKAVQVFRLVTDETVEVKVVERAQQKLKLDAMVVQQGRLQEKEKKMTKSDLLETVRFGADKIFKANKDIGVTDADIDIILEEGRKRTAEMTKLEAADKGDLYDFRLDGGMKTQEFDGVDYSDRAIRDQQLAFSSLAFIDTGKRDRKMVTTYAENVARVVKEGEGDTRPKMPRSMRLPKMEDWQFYNRDRLNELQAMEITLFDQMLEKGELPQNTRDLGPLLEPDLQAEKEQLLGEGFGSWAKVTFNAFLRASSRFGRKEYDKIARDMALPVEEVTRYAQKFWTEGERVFGDDWEGKVKQVEKGEKKIEEIQRLTAAAAELIKMFPNPWDELTFKHQGSHNSGKASNYTLKEDRFLLCLTHLHGYGNWDLIRSSMRRAPTFRFDFFLQSCTSEQLGKRCEKLLRDAERELEQLKKKSEQSNGAGSKKTAEEQAADHLVDVQKRKEESAMKLTRIRDHLQTLKTGGTAGSKNAGGGGATGSGDGSGGAGKGGASGAAGVGADGKSKEKKSGGGGGGGAGACAGGGGGGGGAGTGQVKRPFHEKDMPELCRILRDNDTLGMAKILELFCPTHPEVAKVQVENTVKLVADKETGKWRVRPDYQKYLNMDAAAVAALIAAAASPPAASKKGGGGAAAKKAKKEPPAATAATKRKLDESDAAADAAAAAAATAAAAAATVGGLKLKAPVKPKTAFAFFTAKMKKDAENSVVSQQEALAPGEALAPDAKRDRVKACLKSWFEQLDAAVLKAHEDEADEDQRRYDAEMAVFNARPLPPAPSAAPPAKKVKAQPKAVPAAVAVAAPAPVEASAPAAMEVDESSSPAGNNA